MNFTDRPSVSRPIIGFHPDEEGHWVAELACGHEQHVRHDPPMVHRPWVLTADGRASFLGTELGCVRCAEDRKASTSQIVLRGARWSELLFGLIALLLALGLPLNSPDGRTQFLLVHWYAVALSAFGLVAALRRPSRLVLALTLVLSVYFLTSVVLGLADGRSRSNASLLGGAPFMLSPLLVGMAALAQISVAIRCWQARRLWVR